MIQGQDVLRHTLVDGEQVLTEEHVTYVAGKGAYGRTLYTSAMVTDQRLIVVHDGARSANILDLRQITDVQLVQGAPNAFFKPDGMLDYMHQLHIWSGGRAVETIYAKEFHALQRLDQTICAGIAERQRIQEEAQAAMARIPLPTTTNVSIPESEPPMEDPLEKLLAEIKAPWGGLEEDTVDDDQEYDEDEEEDEPVQPARQLMRIIQKVCEVQASDIESKDDLAAVLTDLSDADTLIVKDIHLWPEEWREAIRTRRCPITIGEGPHAISIMLDLSSFKLIQS